MTTPHAISQRRYISFPAVAARRPSRLHRAMRHLLGVVLLPLALCVAAFRRTPGLAVRLRCVALGCGLVARSEARRGFMLLTNPMDSFRYFELAFVDACTGQAAPDRYLDVSSPRLVPLLLLHRHRSLVADILNPIEADLFETVQLASALGVGPRCRTSSDLIEDVPYQDASFDLITSISVVEHIPNDDVAVARMWRLLRPGGRLLLTVPCAREACEEFADLDEYELLAKDLHGYVYWQRYYDRAALQQRIWSTTGAPASMQIFGEIVAGSYDKDVERKRAGQGVAYWWEPVMMGRDYRHYDDFDQLPGMGVVAMQFIKPSGAGDE